MDVKLTKIIISDSIATNSLNYITEVSTMEEIFKPVMDDDGDDFDFGSDDEENDEDLDRDDNSEDSED